MDHNIDEIVRILRETTAEWTIPIVTELAQHGRNPYAVLISTLLSLRTKDDVTRVATERLLALAGNPREMVTLTTEQIEKAIFPVGFYRNKAKNIIEVSQSLIDVYDGSVPDDLDKLLELKGVGRKTANLVLTQGYGIDAICVDTHVHRITNRWGYVSTANPTETEFALREKLPKKYWIVINDLLVAFGQNLCKPISPLCSQCPIHVYCQRIGVTVSR